MRVFWSADVEVRNSECGVWRWVIDWDQAGLAVPTFLGEGTTGALFDKSRVDRYSLWRRYCESASPLETAAFIRLKKLLR
jgi:hypothetical protein